MQNSPLNIPALFAGFDDPICPIDCGSLCAPHNPSGKPFCCDICQAVPVAYTQEWEYLKAHTSLWHTWLGDECTVEPQDPLSLQQDTPEYMCLLACQGVEHCQREFRSISCRQFPFFPYITSNDRFIGLAYNWDFESTCWVISNLGQVSTAYRQAFIRTYDLIFSQMPEDYESYYCLSEEMREECSKQHRRIPLLHRNGKEYLISPASERLQLVKASQFRKFSVYKSA